MTDEWLSVTQAATALGRSVRSVRRYIREGKLETREVELPGGQFRYEISGASVEALGGEIAPAPPAGAPAQAGGLIDKLTEALAALERVTEGQKALAPAPNAEGYIYAADIEDAP